jgi:hypothetical protein
MQTSRRHFIILAASLASTVRAAAPELSENDPPRPKRSATHSTLRK